VGRHSRFENTRVLITGAGGGLGRALTERFLDEGASVAALDIDADALDALAAACAPAPETAPAAERSEDESAFGTVPRLVPIVCDLSDGDDMLRAVERALAEVGPIDILVNNAGVVSGRPVLEQTDEDMLRVFRINTFAPIRMTRLLLPGMIERGRGHIVTIASAGGFIGTPRLSAYAASKFAAVGFDEALRMEMKASGHPIRTTIVCPYYIDTGMFEGVRSRFPLLPILGTDRVADRVMNAVARGKRRLLMPLLVYLIFPLRLLPVGLFDLVARWLGVSGAMREFRGRSRRERTPGESAIDG
jgi:all-trans-retinol dehydrogenase (NAD+)